MWKSVQASQPGKITPKNQANKGCGKSYSNELEPKGEVTMGAQISSTRNTNPCRKGRKAANVSNLESEVDVVTGTQTSTKKTGPDKKSKKAPDSSNLEVEVDRSDSEDSAEEPIGITKRKQLSRAKASTSAKQLKSSNFDFSSLSKAEQAKFLKVFKTMQDKEDKEAKEADEGMDAHIPLLSCWLHSYLATASVAISIYIVDTWCLPTEHVQVPNELLILRH